MNGAMTFLGGAGVGAGLMFLFDPTNGRRRRHLASDQFWAGLRRAECDLERSWRDLRQRVRGRALQTMNAFATNGAPDAVVVQRVRSKLGRWVSHPHAIKVEAHNGHVVLTGPILADEVERLVRNARGVPGVRFVENRLEVHKDPGRVPALQSTGRLRSQGWTADLAPGNRLAAGAAGAALMAYAFTRTFPMACLFGSIGLGLWTIAAGGRRTALGPASRGGGEGSPARQESFQEAGLGDWSL